MPYGSHLYREIHEQPAVLETFLASEQSAVQAVANAVQNRHVRHVLIAARSTSDNAGRYAQYLLGAKNGMPVALAAPSLYTIYGHPPNVRDMLVIGISQSGQSPDIVAVIEDARRQGAVTTAITNPRFETNVNGEFVQYSGVVDAGEVLTIDIGTQTATIDGTTRADAGLISGHAWMIDLDPATTTACTATVSSAADYDLTVRWYDRWL